VAQQKYTYVYDNRGTEIHCLKDHTEVHKLDFLKDHFLLTSIGDQGILRFQDTTYGKIIAQFRTKLGPCDAMSHDKTNGVSLLGHGNGCVTLWSPNMGTPLVKMLCHRGPIRALAVDPRGHYVATAGADCQVKIHDLRTYKEVHSYFSAAPAVDVDISQRGMLSVAYGGRVQIWDASAILGAKASAPYLNHSLLNGGVVSCTKFCPYDDALGLGHSNGFSNLIIPGAGEPNYDTMVANPFETKNQRREQEVAQLMDKLAPETIQVRIGPFPNPPRTVCPYSYHKGLSPLLVCPYKIDTFLFRFSLTATRWVRSGLCRKRCRRNDGKPRRMRR